MAQGSMILGAIFLLLLGSVYGQLSIGFTELDYTVFENEPATRPVEIVKSGTNMGDITISFQYLTLDQYIDAGNPTGQFDIASLVSTTGSGVDADYLPMPSMLTIPPSTGIVEMNFTADILNDMIHEAEEGYFIIARFAFGDTTDRDQVNVDNITALIRIENDDSISFGFETTPYNLVEGSGAVEVVFGKLNGIRSEVDIPVMVEFTNMPLTGIDQGSDFTLDGLNDTSPAMFAFSPSDTSFNLTLTPLDDNILETMEMFSLTIVKDNSVTDVNIDVDRGRSIVNILDNEVINVGFAMTAVTVTEGATAIVAYEVMQGNIVISPEVAAGIFGVQLQLTVTNGTAGAGDDFMASDTSVIIMHQRATDQFMITQPSAIVMTVDDDVPEETEVLNLLLTNLGGSPPGSFNISVPMAQIIIQDNDATSSVIELAQTLYSTSEDMGFVELCVSITDPTDLTLLADDYQANLTLNLLMDTAEEDSDYYNFTRDFTLTSSASEQCFNVTILDDEVLETLEQFSCTLEAAGNLPQEASLGITEAEIDIADNDFGIVGFDPENVTVTEEQSAIAMVSIRFLSPAPELISSSVFTQLSVMTMDGTAQEVEDYENVSMTVTLMGGATESIIMVRIVDDVFVEDTESLNLVFMVMNDNAAITYAPDTATITILDIDVPTPVVVGLEREVYSVDEDGVQVEICAAILNNSTNQRLTSAELITLEPLFDASFNFSLTEISALAGVDYSDVFMSFSLTPSNPFQCYDVSITNDDIFELDEYFNASLTLNGVLPAGASLGITESFVQIMDDDTAVIGFRETMFTVSEAAGNVVLYVEFMSPANISSDVQIDISLVTVDDTAIGGSDFDEENIVFELNGVTREVFEIDVNITDDNIVETPNTEQFEVMLSSTHSLVLDGRVTINPDRAVITIVENDVFINVLIGIERSAYNVSEGDGVVEVCVAIVEPSSPLTLQDTYVADLTFDTANDTAFAGEDYGELDVSFPLTPTSPRQCFNISINDDEILEIPEIFVGNLVLEDPPPPATSIGISQTLITIQDNEIAVIGFEPSDVVVVESELTAEVSVTFLSPAIVSSAVEIVLTIDTDNGTAIAGQDYDSLVNFSLPVLGVGLDTVSAGIAIINDDIPEIPTRENFTASLTLQSANVPVIIDRPIATITIVDDDNVTRIGFQQDIYNTMEGNGVIEICAAVLDPSDPSLIDPSLSVSIRIQLEDGSAIAPDDYQSLVEIVQFTASAIVQCVNISIVDDEDLENTEEFVARLEPDGTLPATVTLEPDTATISIADNEVPSMIGFEMGSYTVEEDGGVVEICVAILSPSDPTTLPSSYSASINVSTVSGTALVPADYASQFGSFVLTPSMARACINVTIEDDTILERDEAFSGSLVGMIPPTATLDPNFTTVFITDDEMGVIGILNQTVVVREDVGMVTIYFGYIQPDEIASGIIVNITFSTDDSAAIAGQDYEAVRESFILQQGDTIRGVPITIIHDSELENTETFITQIESDMLPDRVTINPAQGTVSIDDVIQPSLVSPSPSPSPSIIPGGGDNDTGGGGMGGDPHYSIMLPTGQLLCFSVHGEKNFPFNLISNSLLQMNAFFIEDAKREEITWIGSLGVVVQHSSYKKSNTTKIRFEAKDQMIYINNGVSLLAKRVEKLTLNRGKLTITEGLRRRGNRKPEVEVDLVDIGLHFTVRFVKKRHLDMMWKKVELQPEDSHGFIGQFLRRGVSVDEIRKLLILPAMEPVPVMRSSVWHFMEREGPEPDQQYCWQTMNPGYQGKGLIQGSYLDYLVDDVLSSNFKFSPKSTE